MASWQGLRAQVQAAGQVLSGDERLLCPSELWSGHQRHV